MDIQISISAVKASKTLITLNHSKFNWKTIKVGCGLKKNRYCLCDVDETQRWMLPTSANFQL